MDLILEEPEDDSIGVETCCPKNSNIIVKFVVFDWYSVIYILKIKPNLTYPDINSVVAFSLVAWRNSLTVVNNIIDNCMIYNAREYH